jgi:hypothetical protein
MITRVNCSNDYSCLFVKDSRSDIDGFISNPLNGELDAVTITAAKSEIVPVSKSGKRLQVELEKIRELLECGKVSFVLVNFPLANFVFTNQCSTFVIRLVGS